ncbi:hypothetical protein NEIRO03_2431 [Nematocida sp. AWRm78]|nr:hypothetical protein NEIRO03_2431 [Nematocida sp. AWRm78]
MKNGMIILKLLLVMYTVCARLDLYDIKTIGETVIIQEDNLLINPDGPLNLLRGYIMHKSGYMYNKRFYTPEIDTKYILEKKDNEPINNRPKYEYKRIPINDIAYENIYTDAVTNNYLIRFHKQLINMFPSTDKSLSITAGRPDALYSFLIKDEVRPQSMYILAAFFLLSEQVDIPILTGKKKEKERRLVLKSLDGKNTYINQSLVLYEDEKELPPEQENYHTNTVGFINFLKDYVEIRIKQLEKKRGYIEPSTYEQFMTGGFLNTPKFLVQSYIYEFIDTPGRYIEFVEAVYTILTDQIENNPAVSKKKKRIYNGLLKNYFIKKDDLPYVTNHIDHILNLRKAKDSYKISPFSDSSQLPAYTQVKSYDRKNEKEIDDIARKYSNCVEVGILGIVCCLLYDLNNRIYTTDHLSDKKETEPLKKFFKDYPNPMESASYNMQQDWCRVVAGLNNDKIVYLKKRGNELESSLLNVLYVISEITGNKEEVLKEIKHIEDMCKPKNSYEKEFDITRNLTNIFIELSNNKDLEIDSKKFTVGKRKKDKKHDLFGEFHLLYIYEEIKAGISINIGNHHVRLDTVGDLLLKKQKTAIKTKLTEIQNIYSNSEKYTACTIRQYINIELNITRSNPKSQSFLPSEQIQEIIRNNHDNINNIFLHGMILSLKEKAAIVGYFLTIYLKNPQPTNNSLVRFTNNLIGSTLLDDLMERKNMLIYCMYNSDSKDYYLRVKECWDEVSFCTVIHLIKTMNNTLLQPTHSYEISLECFIKAMKAISRTDEKYNINNFSSLVIMVIKSLSMKTDDPIKTFSELLDIIYELVIQPDGSNMFYICLKWVVDVIISDVDDKKDTINILMDRIDINYVLNIDDRWDRKFISHSYILKHLMNNRSLLCDENDSESVNKYDSIINKISKFVTPNKKGFFQKAIESVICK